MAKKKISETLAQQRKARQDFLDLKKMQKGEMDAGPKPSEVAIEPKTVSEKISNYWFHFKWHTIGAILAVIGLSVLITQCSQRPDWDMRVVYFSYTAVMDLQTEEIADYLETVSKDLNGDGEVNIQVINCSMNNDNNNLQLKKNSLATLQAQMAVEEQTVLYITDTESYTFFNKDSVRNFFKEEPVPLNSDFYEGTKSKDLGSLPQGLQISYRNISEEKLKNNKNLNKVYSESVRLTKVLKEK